MSLLDIFTEKDTNKLLFLPNIGISHNRVNSYNGFIHDQAKLFFKILDEFKLDYYVFAGSSIGLIRNQNNIPWIDDYDIIIFEHHFKYFEKKIAPILKKNKFEVKFFLIKGIKAGVQIFSNNLNTFKNYNGQYSKFHCDIFYTLVDKNNIIKNTCNWGLYSRKNINVNLVKPKVYKDFNGIKLPFFKNYKKDVELEYGDIINNCIINITHGKKIIQIKKNFNEIYYQYNDILEISKINSKNLIEGTIYNIDNNDINNLKDNILNENNYFLNFNIISFIQKNNIKVLEIKKNNIIKYIYNIRYYCPEIKIIINIPNFEYKYLFILNYVNEFHCYKKENLDFLNNSEIFWLNKPKIIIKIEPEINKYII